jgi:hypothetical protein
VTAGCPGYSLLLAAQDLLPIVLGAIGFVALGRRATESLPALTLPIRVVVIALVVGSAVAGPTRKFAIALGADCADLQWMQIPFFVAVPIGFAVLAWAVRSVLAARMVAVWPYATVAAVAVVAAAAAQRDLILLAVGGLLAVLTAAYAAVLAWRQRDSLTAALYIAYAVATLSLPGAAAAEYASAATGLWVEQAINTTAQALFAVASVRLLRSAPRLGESAPRVTRSTD